AALDGRGVGRAAALDLDGDPALVARQALGDVADLGDRLTVEGLEHVALAQAELVGERAGLDLAYRQRAVLGLDLGAEPRLAVGEQLAARLAGHAPGRAGELVVARELADDR